MFFDQELAGKYIPFNETGIPILLWKKGYTWEICLAQELDDCGFPARIGQIVDTGVGDLPNSTKLAWDIKPEYRGQGIMSAVLKTYLEENIPVGEGFEVTIRQGNHASLKLALSAGFSIYKEVKDCLFLIRR